MELCWQQVTLPTSVCSSKVISLPHKFLSNTVTPDSPGINLEVFPEKDTLIHMGRWFHQHMDMLLVFHVTFMSPSVIIV